MTPPNTQSALGDASGELGYRIARLVADVEGRDPVDLTPPLHDAVNLDALGSLFRSGRGDGRATFGYRTHRITVDADGTISVGE